MSEDPLLGALRRRFPIQSSMPFNTMDYIHAQGSPLEAWMYSRLFWPTFIQIEGMVFLRDSVEDADDVERVRQALSAFQGDKRLTQSSFNTFVIAELFGPRAGDTTEEEDGIIAEILADMWRARLQLIFPERKSYVTVESPDTSSGVAVAFYVE